MTEQEWLKQPWAYAMFEFLSSGGKPSVRKLRLFAVGCCRRIWHHLPDERNRRAVTVAERFADDLATKEEMEKVCQAAQVVSHSFQPPWNAEKVAAYHAAWASGWAASEEAWATWLTSTEATKTMRGAASALQTGGDAVGPERAKQSDLLRDIFGNPFRPVSINPSWLTPTVSRLTATAYEERALPSGELDSARLAMLADALEEAGCANTDILNHCRSEGPHVRGCWVVDLILGKQ